MTIALTCSQCGKQLAVLRRPLRRLRWTKYWWRGVASLFGSPLKICTECGAIYTYQGDLVAAGAAETDAEIRLQGFRQDMAMMRDGFAMLVLGGEVGAVFTLFQQGAYEPGLTFILAAFGTAALIPTAFFARQVRLAKRDLKLLKRARNQLENRK